jgi:hypothetical protein
MSRAYFTSQIGDLLEETPEGFLISRDCVIGRTGWQTYKIHDLPQDALSRMGVDTSSQQANIDLYRPAEEVFARDALASFEGKPLTDNHPPGFVDPSNFSEYARGHIQNVRRGKEPLESGEWPMIADVHVTAEPLLSKVRNKLVRELSCGYDYSIRQDGNKILQTDITGNHVAVVPKGRAGSEARINDAAPVGESPPDAALSSEPVVEAATDVHAPLTAVKEKRRVKDFRKLLLGIGLKNFAKDAEPEELAEATKALHEEPPATSEDRRGKDDPGEQEPMMTDRKKLHDALDRAMDKRRGGMDSDMAMLKDLLDEYMGEEMQEPEHMADTTELEETLADNCPGCGQPMDDCSCAMDEDDPDEGAEIGEETEPSGEEVVVGDRVAAADGARAVLKLWRPHAARSKDTAERAAFNAALGVVTKTSRAGTGGYGAFARAGRARDKAPAKPAGQVIAEQRGRTKAFDDSGFNPNDRNKKLQEAYDSARKGGK